MYDCGKDCLILVPFRLPQMSCFTLSLKCFSSDSDNWRPEVGIGPCFSSPTGQGQIQSYLHSRFPPSSFVLPSFAWFYVFFSTGQVLLSALGWCSVCTSVSEGVFLMYPWGEVYSMSSYSTNLFSKTKSLLTTCKLLYLFVTSKMMMPTLQNYIRIKWATVEDSDCQKWHRH